MPEDPTATPTYSVSLRLRRVTVEYAHIQVPVNDEILQTDAAGAVAIDDNGHAHLDPDKLVQRAMEMAGSGPTHWHREEETIEPHPIQRAPEPDEE